MGFDSELLVPGLPVPPQHPSLCRYLGAGAVTQEENRAQGPGCKGHLGLGAKPQCASTHLPWAVVTIPPGFYWSACGSSNHSKFF